MQGEPSIKNILSEIEDKYYKKLELLEAEEPKGNRLSDDYLNSMPKNTEIGNNLNREMKEAQLEQIKIILGIKMTSSKRKK